MHKFSGVTLDFYDDHGATLKAKFPVAEQLPQLIKEADVKPKERLPNDAFALIMEDQGHIFRKFACNDPGTTAMSAIYFMEHGDKLPGEAQKVAASCIVEACGRFGLMPPETLTKVAEVAWEDRDPVVSVTGQAPAAKTKLARPDADGDYAVILEDGSRHYPIDTWDRVKLAEAYYQEEQIRMQPEIRRQFAVKLASKCYDLGYPLDADIFEAGSPEYANTGHIKASLEMRKTACDPAGGGREFLDELMDKVGSIQPEVFAETLRRFDVQTGLHQGWDHLVLDPWASTFGIDKVAKVVWEQGADRVTEDQLKNLAQNQQSGLQEIFNEGFTKEFVKDPVSIFNSMPDPQKKIIARMACDEASMGGSEVMTSDSVVG
jgi:hypothetical protein